MKLVMTLLVKNEARILEDNIRFHAEQGVDAFLVMNNGSTDQTDDLLADLSHELDIHVVQNSSSDYLQSQWMTSLAHQAVSQLHADLVISNDADEFWVCSSGGDLKSKLRNRDAVVTVQRYNYVQSKEALQSDRPYWQADAKVVNPVLYVKNDQLERTRISMPLVKISPKVVVNPRGLLKIKGGNHRARHLRFWASRNEPGIEVHHYPIRGYAHFAENIQHRASLLKANPETRMGDHYRRWVKLMDEGRLREEFDRMSICENEIDILQRIGVIRRLQSPIADVVASHH
ncbi:Uncharacterised protein [BD1-7 clade bacterium]|uniref:Glycosyltransferase 2-like domain-containing protein n=1 Tax=BD1-7 clade bacterium TaxID=2029982 RepID=A0A5S9QYB7_9GAMM|nr:Uncharacterised protein [BD1-7 clade bacterium]